MKLRCPRCDSRITVPDDWAGRLIRCRGCNKAFRIPRPNATIAPTSTDAGLDLDNLADLERSALTLDGRERAEAEAEQQADAPPAAEPAAPTGGPTERICPSCRKPVRVKNPYVDVLCPACFEPLPALPRPGAEPAVRMTRQQRSGGFYDGLASAFVWPLGAWGSLIAGMTAAIGATLIPVMLYVAVAFAVEQGQAGLATQKAPYLGGLQKGLYVFILLETLVFATVAVHAFLDVIRSTSVGAERPPGLVWVPSQWGSSFLAYLALVAYYALFTALALWLSSKEGFSLPTSLTDFRARLTPAVLGMLAFFTFFVPMHLIGIGITNPIRGLDPARVGRSLASTHVHYLFLLMLVAVYGTLFAMAFWAVLHWFVGVLARLSQAAATGDLVEVAGGLLCWGLVTGFGFYGIYLLGRLHGLFAKSFRKRLAFDD
ncbi:MAG: hypothetical protein U1A27_07120 [Phycisphaerae bacterium]